MSASKSKKVRIYNIRTIDGIMLHYEDLMNAHLNPFTTSSRASRVGNRKIHHEENQWRINPFHFHYKSSRRISRKPRPLCKVIGRHKGGQERFVSNVAEHVSQVKREWLRDEVYDTSSPFSSIPGFYVQLEISISSRSYRWIFKAPLIAIEEGGVGYIIQI